MKAEELRINNLVYKSYPDGKEICTINNVSKNFINGLGISAIEPIPLTEEWLLKFGFKYDEFISPMYRPKAYSILGMTLYKESEIFCYSNVKLKYVHQLQNLYFALTGVELELPSNN
jgi:hypothetical protein